MVVSSKVRGKPKTLPEPSTASSRANEIRELAESDLEVFIRLVAPKQVLGAIHIELINWITRQKAKNHQLVLMPRDHQKSRIAAFFAVWQITKTPDIRIIYLSATATLAEKQLKFMKDILLSPIYTKYWPEMVNPEEGKRERWTTSEIAVDHPKRKEEGVRDSTIDTGGLTKTITGLHCDLTILDDIVVDENANSTEGREKVKQQYSLLASIEGTDSRELVVGTHYHPKDLYMDLKQMEEEIYDNDGGLVSSELVYEVFERTVEDRGDGTGTYLWPRQMRSDGKWFGFDQKILSQKRAKYLSKSAFKAQYYNDPNDLSDAPIPSSKFQYYDKKHLYRLNGAWFFKNQRLNVFASIDFAYSLTRKSDYTALVVIGITSDRSIYVLDIERIKTDRISDYYDLIIKYHTKWGFRKLRAETIAAQKTVVKELKNSYLIPNGISISIEESNPNRHQGTKEERVHSILEPKYTDLKMWHFQGGECQNLEEELVMRRPPHDDIKDALASVIEIAVPPMGTNLTSSAGPATVIDPTNVVFHPRFGGVAI